MKIYTKTGDRGETGLFGGPRIRKDDSRLEAYGSVDELNAAIGLARSELLPPEIARVLQQVQHDLFAVGAELATPNPGQQGTAWLGPSQTQTLEEAIDALDAGLPPLKHFILPDGCRAACLLQLGRAICRRAERRVVALAGQPGVADASGIMTYLNRLSDYLFVAARAANVAAGKSEAPWEKPTV